MISKTGLSTMDIDEIDPEQNNQSEYDESEFRSYSEISSGGEFYQPGSKCCLYFRLILHKISLLYYNFGLYHQQSLKYVPTWMQLVSLALYIYFSYNLVTFAMHFGTIKYSQISKKQVDSTFEENFVSAKNEDIFNLHIEAKFNSST